MKLTPAEEQVIKEMREKAEAQKPFREAFLKHDLYDHLYLNGCYFQFKSPYEYDFHLSPEQVQEITDFFKGRFHLLLKKGARLVSYIEEGEEQWYYEENGVIEGVGNDWAEKHLENFKNLR
jgi:hypothetical protein